MGGELSDVVHFESNGSAIEFTYGDSSPVTFFSPIERIERIEEGVRFDSQAGAELAAQLMRLPMFTSRLRVIGWGSGGLTQYMDNWATFVGLFDFEGLTIVDGYEGPGTAHITVEGNTFPIDADVLFDLDFSAYLPAP